MTQKPTTGELQQEISWEDAVARYLEENPDYFQRHPDLLSRITLMHQTGGRAISLIERQVQVLRDENRNLQRQLRELLGNARDNDTLTERLHRFALAMSDARALDDALDGASDMLRQDFSLDGVRILLRGRDGFPPGRAEVAGDDETLLDDLLRRAAGGKPVCGEAPDAATLRALFGDHATDIKTWALLTLGGALPFGVLCLGSRDPLRFHAGQGTVYLARLGELLTHGLAHHRR